MATLDGVTWSVRRDQPFRRPHRAATLQVTDDEHIGFEGLIMVLGSIVLLLATPILWQARIWPVLLLAVPWLAATWYLYWARWPILILRQGQVMHGSRVRGRAPAARMVMEYAKEIARTEDTRLRS